VEFHCLLLETEENIARLPPGAYVSELHITKHGTTAPFHGTSHYSAPKALPAWAMSLTCSSVAAAGYPQNSSSSVGNNSAESSLGNDDVGVPMLSSLSAGGGTLLHDAAAELAQTPYLTYPPGEGALVANSGFYPSLPASSAGLITGHPGLPYPAATTADTEQSAGATTQSSSPLTLAFRAPSPPPFSPEEFDETVAFLLDDVDEPGSSQHVHSDRGKENVTPSAYFSCPLSSAPAAPVHMVTRFYCETGDNSCGSNCSSRDVPSTADPAATPGHITTPGATKKRAAAGPCGYDGYGAAVPVTPSYTASASLVRPTAVHGNPCRRLTEQDAAPTAAAARVFQGSFNAADPEELFPLCGGDLFEDLDWVGEAGLYPISRDWSA
jgi:hypothetical protein